MEIYERLIENPLFFKWIYHPGPEIDSWWNAYLEIHPKEADLILRFKQRFNALEFSIEKLSEAEKKALAKRIMLGLEAFDKKKKHQQFVIGLTRYVAVALIFFSIGSIFVNYRLDKKNTSQFTVLAPISHQLQGPVLILPQGNSVPLKKTESTLDYTHPDQIVLNNESIIKMAPESEKSPDNQLIVPYGNRSKVTLSDSTVVWLNAGSRLIYPSKFTGATREVMLEGEAFFEVTKNKKVPFVVKTSMIEVKVFGTQFNVSAFPEDNLIQTVLKEGSVSVHTNNSGILGKDVLLEPNQMASFDRTTQDTKVLPVNAAASTLWTQGLLSFDDLEMCRVLKSLERYYNIQIHYANPSVGLQRISGKLDFNKERDEVFEYLSKVSNTKFTKIDDHNYQIK